MLLCARDDSGLRENSSREKWRVAAEKSRFAVRGRDVETGRYRKEKGRFKTGLFCMARPERFELPTT